MNEPMWSWTSIQFTQAGGVRALSARFHAGAIAADGSGSPQDARHLHFNLSRHGRHGYGRKSFDILTAFRDVWDDVSLKSPTTTIGAKLIVDTAMNLETNATNGLSRGQLAGGPARTAPKRGRHQDGPDFPLRNADIDALDFTEMCLPNDRQVDPAALNDTYVLENFRPAVTKKNWRMDCGVAGYDNTSDCRPSSRPGCAARTTSIGCGTAGRRCGPPMWMPPESLSQQLHAQPTRL